MPYWRLSSFYFFYFAILGALIPYWGLYLQFLGFNALEIGQLTTILLATKIISPYLWGWLSDYLGTLCKILKIGAFLTAFFFGLTFLVTDFMLLGLVMALFSFFWHAILPQFEVITLRYIDHDLPLYSKIRLWGSIGFCIAVFCVGIALDYWHISFLLPILMILYILLWLISLLIDEPHCKKPSLEHGSIYYILKNKTVITFLVISFLMQLGHGAYYSFYSIFLAGNGYSKSVIGILWALGVVAEIIIFMFMPSLMRHFNIKSLLLMSLVVATIRWLVITWGYQSLSLLIVAQMMHAATFGIFHAAAIHFIHHTFTGAYQNRGQALYGSISFGAGGALGGFMSGYYWDSLGASFCYLISAVISFIAILITIKWLDLKV